jgi:undecaprenyl-diphosphatase
MLEDLLKAAILGTIQGLTEFLPVSSTGHLILAQKALRVDEDEYGLAFDAAIHLGTLASLLLFYGSRWLRLGEGLLRSIRARAVVGDPDGRLAWLIIVATLPAAVLGLVFENQIEDVFRSPWLVATMLIAFSAVFVYAETVSRRDRDTGDASLADALMLGFAQAVALIPGVSRSGATISAGLMRNLERREAANFAFLMSAPIIAGAGLKQMVDVVGDFVAGRLGRDDFAFFATGLIFAAVVGFLAIRFMLAFLGARSLNWFVGYRVALGLLVFAVLIVDAAV